MFSLEQIYHILYLILHFTFHTQYYGLGSFMCQCLVKNHICFHLLVTTSLLFVHPSIYPSIYPSINHPSTHQPSIHLPIYLQHIWYALLSWISWYGNNNIIIPEYHLSGYFSTLRLLTHSLTHLPCMFLITEQYLIYLATHMPQEVNNKNCVIAQSYDLPILIHTYKQCLYVWALQFAGLCVLSMQLFLCWYSHEQNSLWFPLPFCNLCSSVVIEMFRLSLNIKSCMCNSGFPR